MTAATGRRKSAAGGAETLAFRNVSKTFATNKGTTTCFEKLDLTCAAGEITTIVGASGCGKTTVLNLAAGLLRADSGVITFGGHEVEGAGPERAVVFQNYALFPWLTVAENVEFGLKIAKVPAPVRRDKVRQHLQLVGLEHAADRLPKQLSGGMRQRCALARALVTGPGAVLMDEPFGALDAITRLRLQQELLNILAVRPTTVLFITHDIEEAAFLSNRVLVMRPHPQQIVADIDVPYEFPRNDATRSSAEFLHVKEQLWTALEAAHV